jgi:hypothetical protein
MVIRKEAPGMADQTTREPPTFVRDFEGTLSKLDNALADAANAVSAIRSFIPQFAALAQVVSTIESAVSQARENLDVRPAAVATTLRPVPAAAPATVAQAAPAPVEEEKKPVATGTQCLRLHVTKPSGSLDLKTVDNALNEHTEIIDLALLDYDGRQATLKVWISGQVDEKKLRESLTADLLQRVGGDAEVKIDFDQESAAA